VPKRPRYEVVYDGEVVGHLGAIERKHHPTIRSAIERGLTHEPFSETRNRKPLERPTGIGADWELRCGPKNCFRVFYRADAAARRVSVLAIARKDRNQLYVGEKEFEL
jgi:hypothetical protein